MATWRARAARVAWAFVRRHRERAAQRADHERHRAADADGDRAVRLERQWANGLRHRGRRVGRSQELGPFRADCGIRHGFEADAARPDQLRGLAAAQSRLHRDRHADRDRARPVHDRVPAVRRAQGRADPGLSLHVRASRSARDRAQNLRHDLREARRRPGRVQHANRVRERGEAQRRRSAFG